MGADLQRMLSALGAVSDAASSDEFADAVVTAVTSAVGADGVLVTPFGSTARRIRCWPEGFFGEPHQSALERLNAAEPWPLVSHTRDGLGNPVRISDMLSRRAYHHSAIYSELFGPLDIHYQAAFSLTVDGQHAFCVAMSRERRDFSPTDLDRLELLRRPLTAGAARVAHLERIADPADRCGGRSLSSRELDVLALLACGLSNDAIGRRLEISPRTVNKHLEHLFVKLGVSNRTEAAALWHRRSPSVVGSEGPLLDPSWS